MLPYLFEHKKVLSVVIALSVLGAAASLAQPLLVGQVITRVQHGNPLGGLVWVLVVLVVVAGLIAGYQHYLLQRTGEGVVLSSRKRLVAKLLHLPIAEFDTRRTGDRKPSRELGTSSNPVTRTSWGIRLPCSRRDSSRPSAARSRSSGR